MSRKCKVVIKKTLFPLDGILNYDVQLWYDFTNSTTGKTGYVYAGYGKYFADIEQAKQYAIENATDGIIYE